MKTISEGATVPDFQLPDENGDLVRLSDKLADGPVVLVGHDSVNRALLLKLLEQPLSAYWRIAQGPAALNEIDIVRT